MSDYTPSLGGAELFEEVTIAARQALSVARRRSPQMRRSFGRGRYRGHQLQRYTMSRTRRIRGVHEDRPEVQRDAQRRADDRLDSAGLSRAAMLARWATAVATAEVAQAVVSEIASDDIAGLDAAQLDADNAQIQADAWEERLRTDEGIDVSGLASEKPSATDADHSAEPSPLIEATTAATAELADAEVEPVPADSSVGDLLEHSGLGAEHESPSAEPSGTSFAPGPDLAPAVDLDRPADHGIND